MGWARLVTLVLTLGGIAVDATAQSHEHRQKVGAKDSTWRAMQGRGKIAMGVDQYVSSHRFDALPDGGQIELETDLPDSGAVQAIRQHFAVLVEAFRAGDFKTPLFVHDEEVPGSRVMSANRDRIRYEVIDLAKGGGLRIRTVDPRTIAAVHEFLAYQRREHRVGAR